MRQAFVSSVRRGGCRGDRYIVRGRDAWRAEGMTEAEDRYQRERGFHDQTFETNSRESAGRFYAVLAPADAAFDEKVQAAGKGARILEYGCGQGGRLFRLAPSAASLSAIDLSPVGVEQARLDAEERGLDVDLRVMNAEALEFDDGSFDLIVGNGILHHLDLGRAFSEIHRVLVPGGRGLFMEPLGHNPMVNLYRRMTPKLRTPDEHPLVMADFALAERSFEQVEVTMSVLTSLLALPLAGRGGDRFDRLLSRLTATDDALFRRSALARRNAWYATIELVRG